MPGWKVFTVGDDIAWLHPGPDGRLWAINPEAGYFGVVPGHQSGDQPQRLRHDPPRHAVHQRRAHRGQPALVGRPEGRHAGASTGRAARTIRPTVRPRTRTHASPSRRDSNPSYSPHAEDARGVPISRHRLRRPPPRRSRRWCTRRATGSTACWSAPRSPRRPPPPPSARSGVVRRDPMAMQPFCGYNFGDYWQHWLNVGAKLTQAAADLPRQLVPPRCAGQVPVAGLRREPAGAGLDAGARAPARPAPPRRRSARCRAPQDLNTAGAGHHAGGARASCCAWTRRCGARKSRRLREYLAQVRHRACRRR